jgi:hypothetical protein
MLTSGNEIIVGWAFSGIQRWVPVLADPNLEVLLMPDHTDPYPERVLALEAEGMTTSDAQAVADAELMGAKLMRRKVNRRRHHAALKAAGKKPSLISRR